MLVADWIRLHFRFISCILKTFKVSHKINHVRKKIHHIVTRGLRFLAFLINGLLQSFFQQLDLTLVDFKLEFGANNQGQILLSDEISPDTCRIWDNRIGDPKERILDKDRFRQDLGGVINAYGEVLKRIQGVSSKPRICS